MACKECSTKAKLAGNGEVKGGRRVKPMDVIRSHPALYIHSATMHNEDGDVSRIVHDIFMVDEGA